MLTVINWYTARKSRKSLQQLVGLALTNTPTLLAIVSDKYTSEENIRPFAPIAEHFGARLHVILAAEWDQPEREADGEVLLRGLGLAPAARPRLLRDQGPVRTAVVLRQKQPIALIDLFFEERGYTTLDGKPDPRAEAMRARQEQAFVVLQELLGKLPPQPPPPPRVLQPGEHDFSPQGLCRMCSGGRATLTLCPGTKRDEGPARDRFELIELD